MGSIVEQHVEWAVVNRLKTMLDVPPKTKFNVTQSFALFSAVLLWTKNRVWVGGDRAGFSEADHAARGAREALQTASIFDPPWSLSKARPQLQRAEDDGLIDVVCEAINSDFEGMTAEQFIKWLRDALAHGDGRTIRPVHKSSRRNHQTFLAGFEIVFPASRGSDRNLILSLYHADMKRIGATLADTFCRALSGGDRYFEREAGTAAIIESA